MRNEKRNSGYEEMSTAALRALIHEDIWEDTLDEDAFREITAELRRREGENPAFHEPRIDESWARLEARLAEESAVWELEPVRTKKRGTTLRWLRAGIAAAAMLAVVSMAVIPSAADGESLISHVASWSKTELWLSPIRDFSQGSLKYSELNGVLKKNHVEGSLLPTWIPERYAYVGCDVDEDFFGKFVLRIRFSHMDGSGLIGMVIQTDATDVNVYTPKDEEDVEEYMANGIRHYLFTYQGNANAIWFHGDTCCSLGGNITKDELKEMIDSIYLTAESFFGG